MLNAIKLNPNYTNLYSDLGVIYEKLGKKREALNAYTKALQLNPQNITAKERMNAVR